MATLT
ncbi:hypothetical protein YPPY04_3231, partial [Yersinia pestis PY-04]